MPEERTLMERVKGVLEWFHLIYVLGDAFLSLGIGKLVANTAQRFWQFESQANIGVWLVSSGVLFLAFAPLAKKLADRISPWRRQTPQSNRNAPRTEDPLPANFDPTEFFRRSYRSPQIEAETRENMQHAAQWYSPENHERFYLDFIAVGLIQAVYDGVWWPLFRSQLEVLNRANRTRNVTTIEIARTIYEDARREFPDEYRQMNMTFENWMNYLYGNTLMLTNATGGLELTVRGKDFLMYLTHWGRDASLKRL